MRILIKTGLLLLLPALPINGLAQQVTIEDFAFLTGYWKGTGLGGDVEEVWMPPVDGRMFGIFKLSGNGELTFTEYIEIVEQDGEFVLRLRHFNPDFSGWEAQDEHVTFKLESVAENQALFRGLTYKLSNDSELEVTVRLSYSDGSTVVEPLHFKRQPLQASKR